jgi:hypothetical protein
MYSCIKMEKETCRNYSENEVRESKGEGWRR